MGSLPKGQAGAIRSNHLDPVTSEARPSALSLELAERMFASLGSQAELPTTSKDDLETFTIELNHPLGPHQYVPLFFDRKSEYGKGHSYFEALCHALPTLDIIDSSSARFWKRVGAPIVVKHLPAPLPIVAFLEALRQKNKPFLDELERRLIAKEATTWSLVEGVSISTGDAIKRFIDGAFRNVAIQVHFKGETKNWDALLHQDHVRHLGKRWLCSSHRTQVFSSLHMGVTLHGERGVAFCKPDPAASEEGKLGKWPPDHVMLPMRKGDVYVSTPASILHGVSCHDLGESDRSVAMQCRTLLDGPSAQFWHAHKVQLNAVVAQLLSEMTITMPTLDETLAAEDAVLAKWKAQTPTPAPEKLLFENSALNV
jgi:hypothetical protein